MKMHMVRTPSEALEIILRNSSPSTRKRLHILNRRASRRVVALDRIIWQRRVWSDAGIAPHE